MPTGLQIVGRPYDDVAVFRAGAAFERLRPWLDAPGNFDATIGLAARGFSFTWAVVVLDALIGHVEAVPAKTALEEPGGSSPALLSYEGGPQDLDDY